MGNLWKRKLLAGMLALALVGSSMTGGQIQVKAEETDATSSATTDATSSATTDATSSATTDATSSATKKALDLTNAVEFASAKSYGGTYEDKFEGAAYTKDGGFVAVGYSMGPGTDPEWDYYGAKDGYYNDAIIVKYKADHSVDWTWSHEKTKNPNGSYSGYSYLFGVDVLNDGRIVAVGQAGYYEIDGYDISLEIH